MPEAAVLDAEPNSYEVRPTSEKSFDPPFYKEWFKTRTAAGFISLTPWLNNAETGEPVGRIVIDIGSVDSNNAVSSSTKCYVDAIDLAVYLRAVATGTGRSLYPQRAGVYSPESYVTFGGTPGTTPVARVFKIEWWGAKKDEPGSPDNGFVWKCGHFDGKVTDQGAIQPLYDKPKSGDMIKRTRQQMHLISYRLDLVLAGWAATTPRWYGV